MIITDTLTIFGLSAAPNRMPSARQDLIRQLRTVGLNINASKTEILAPDTDKDVLAKHFPSQDTTTNAINYMW